MTYRFLKPARQELDEAIAYYERQEDGLGIRLLLTVGDGIDAILENPNTWPRVAPNVRQYRVDPFPYGIMYELQGEEILIVAFADLRRRWGYWIGRH